MWELGFGNRVYVRVLYMGVRFGEWVFDDFGRGDRISGKID